MKNYFPLMVFVALVGHAHAEQSTSETNAMLYLQSVSMEKRAAVCTSRASEFGEQFKKAIPLWRARNAEAIAEGEAFMREDAKRHNIPFEKNVEAATALDAQMLEQAPIELLRHNCAGFLQAMNNG